MKSQPKARIIAGIIAAVVIALIFWFTLPALNLRSPGFWMFVLMSLAVVLVTQSFASLSGMKAGEGTEVDFGGTKVHLPGMPKFPKNRLNKILLWVILGIVALMIVASLIGAEIFHASRYQSLIVKKDGNFTEDIATLEIEQIPVVDRDTAIKLGQRKLGEMSDLVSQFEIADEYYTQINYQDRPVRVTPLVYGDIIKWFNNQSNGIPAYLLSLIHI